MKSKGAVKFFAIALAIVCLFQLSFTFVANRIEKKAESFANGDPVKKRRYLDSVSRETAYNIGIKKYSYLEVKERELNLGLDLRGGMHVTLEVAMEKFLKELSGNNQDPTFNQALANAKRVKVTSQRNYIDIFVEELQKLKPNAQLAAYFATLENKENVKINSTNEQVTDYLKKESQSALERTFDILRARVDRFGVTQPNIQPDFNAGRITVEMPGIDDAERARRLLKGSAKLEFYETYTLNEIFPFMQDADKALLAVQEANSAITTPSANSALGNLAKSAGAAGDTTAKTDTAASRSTLLGIKSDTGNKTLTAADSARKETPLLSALFNVGQITNEMAGSPTIGWVKISDTARINKLLNTPEVHDALPPDTRLLWGAKALPESDVLELTALKTTGILGKEAILYGDAITDAVADIDPQSNAYIVSMQMNPQGASEWARITRNAAAMNPKGHIAIVLDNQVYSAPRVQNEISGGRSQITGNFTAEDSKDLANILKAGKLPVELQVIDEAIVGPSLGEEAIQKGLMSLLVGVLAIAAFMVFYYNRSGWVANIALATNLFFIIGILTSLGAALTLPGMAGIVLTLAMAVDANVLIYERVREELALGKNTKQAIADGFQHALSSIIDGNLTTLLIGIILMAFGTGPIYGFAVVLVIGILTSLFTAILISRLIFEWLLERDTKMTFGNKATNNLFKHTNIDFVGKRKYSYIFSGVVTLIGIISLAVNGLNYGVDFEGGRSYVVDFDKPVKTEEVRSILTKTFGESPEVKTFGADDKVSITTNYLKEGGDEADAQVSAKLMEGLTQLNNPAKIVNSQMVGSTIANDIKNSAFMSILFGLLAVFLYIVVRFKRWQFAAGATIALAHDVFFVLTFFSLFKDWLPFTSVDQAVVAALLTVVGYSINDTVVVFDRIREFSRGKRETDMPTTVNAALNTTLSRTIITALTVWLAVLILFIFGGPIIRGFSFAMLIGVTIGVYSSIFIATPLALDLQSKEQRDSTTF
ncbi:MAG: protein translocase subunit SecDF [Bacteroidia bacterium]